MFHELRINVEFGVPNIIDIVGKDPNMNKKKNMFFYIIESELFLYTFKNVNTFSGWEAPSLLCGKFMCCRPSTLIKLINSSILICCMNHTL
jgi:hypothetical protein